MLELDRKDVVHKINLSLQLPISSEIYFSNADQIVTIILLIMQRSDDSKLNNPVR